MKKHRNTDSAEHPPERATVSAVSRDRWYHACAKVARMLSEQVPRPYRSRTFSGIIGDIKALPPDKAISLYRRKRGLGVQYAAQYLATGIDSGRGYQACAATALDAVAGPGETSVFGADILDVGCAVGVTAGVLGLDRVVGFDLFHDLLGAAQLIDTRTGAQHRYVTADMTRDWPFRPVFDTVVCGLVCHHLKSQGTAARFFRSANRVLKPGGSLIITLPAGSIATVSQIHRIIEGLDSFGFDCNPSLTGLVRSDDEPHSLFWMFLMCAEKRREPHAGPFISDTFSFPSFRTPVPRTVKGDRARKTVRESRQVIHTCFRLFSVSKLGEVAAADEPLVFETVRGL